MIFVSLIKEFTTHNTYYCTLMQRRHIIPCLLIFAYAFSLAHSVIPHEHYNPHTESASPHPHEESKDHHDDKHNHQPGGGLIFPSHFSNSDVSVSRFTISQKVKAKADWQINRADDILLTGLCFLPPVFHVPRDSNRYNQFIFFSRCLRAPPSIS